MAKIGTTMRKSATRIGLLFFIGIVASLLLKGCGEAFNAPNSQQAATISGIVLDQTGQPVEGALVQIVSPPTNRSIVTDSTGFFGFAFKLKSPTNVTIKVSKQGYDPVTKTIAASGGEDYSKIKLILSSAGGGDDPGVGGEPQEPAGIVLVNAPDNTIRIAATGGDVRAPFTFAVVDTAGRPMNSENSVKVYFNIVRGPGGGEALKPQTAMTGESGKVTTVLSSGNRAGPVMIKAIVKRPGEDIISKPIVAAIHGGFPDKEHFSLAATKYNFEAWSRNNRRNTIQVVLGDKFGNPVKPGTVVYFETTGGIIQGSGATDGDGIVEVDLISGDPRPPGGVATVTATTINKQGNEISKQINVVFSTTRGNITISPTTFNIEANGGQSFTYTVVDLNGNPMAKGTQIKVEAGQGIALSGDVDFTLGNFINPGPGATQFEFSIRDTDTESNQEAPLTIRITVTTPSGNSFSKSITGVRHNDFEIPD